VCVFSFGWQAPHADVGQFWKRWFDLAEQVSFLVRASILLLPPTSIFLTPPSLPSPLFLSQPKVGLQGNQNSSDEKFLLR